jgi:SAM-dependent methyltransferase
MHTVTRAIGARVMLVPRMSEAVERERRFWNARGMAYETARKLIGRSIGGFASYGELEATYDPVGRNVLDYGCGRGDDAIRLVRRGAAYVTGLDIAEAEIAHARAAAAAAGLADRTTFVVADAHATGFPDGAFDVIRGVSILHHLDLEPALLELRRILAPGGRAVFVEPLAHNPLLRLGRALTPMARTKDEHPLTVDNWKTCAATFPGFHHFERELITVPLMPLNLILPARGREALAHRMKAADVRALERVPRLRRYARLTFLVLQ